MDPMTPSRHPGAPSPEDLLLAIGFYIEWFPGSVVQAPFDFNAPMPRAGAALYKAPQYQAALLWAMNRVVALALRHDLGHWTDRGFWLNCYDSGADVDIIGPYWEHRIRDAERLGNEAALYPSQK
jgi:hypothetical protein